MSSLFKNSFQSKQLKHFTEITIKAIPSIKRDAIKPIYKTIKSGKCPDFESIESAANLLEKKYKLDLQIASYSKIINDKESNTFSEVQSAKSHVVKLTTNEDTVQLIAQLERTFHLETGSLSHPQTNNTHLHPSRSKSRSLSVTKNSGLSQLGDIENLSESPPSTPSAITPTETSPASHNRTRLAATLNTVSLKALSESPKEANPKQPDRKSSKDKYMKQRSRSVMSLNSNYRSTKRKSDTGIRIIPDMNTKEYLQFLLEKAVTNKSWNDNDADRLCKCAISMKCDWITVHSMWVKKCFGLLRTYTIKQYKNDLKAHRKAKRRGSRMMIVPPKDFKEVKNEKKLKSTCKICVTIGYPLGQTSTVSKVAETKQSVTDGAQRVRLMVSAGKVILEDWDYILHEVKRVVSAANGCDVRIVFPDTNQITEDIKHEFNQKIMQGMASKSSSSNETDTNIARKRKDTKPAKKLLFPFNSDETSDDDDNQTRKRNRNKYGQKRYTKKDDSDTSDDESSVSYCSSVGDAATPRGNPMIIPLSKSEDTNADKKISKQLLRTSSNKKRGKKANKKNLRRASTMTSIKYKAADKKGGGKRPKSTKMSKKKRNTLMINQSTTDSLDIEPAGAEKQKKLKQKKKKRKKNVSNVKSVGDIEELKKGKKKKKRKSIKVTPAAKTSNKSKKKATHNKGQKQRNKGNKSNKTKEKEKKTNNKKNAKKKGKNADKRRAKSVGKLKT